MVELDTHAMDVPEGLNEEYYQINLDILSSFNKFRPPLDIFFFKEDVARIIPYYKTGGRLTTEQTEELPEMVKQGIIFVSRKDHAVYVKHISYQLDLVLVDKNLKEREIADIFTQALTRRLDEFFDQPVAAIRDKLWEDLMVLTEYLHQDINGVWALVKRMHKEHSLANHSFNCGVFGLALFSKMHAKDFEEGGVKRKLFDRLAAGLFLHDLGMCKIPPFIRNKAKPLTQDERTKINQHCKLGVEMLAKLDLKFPEIEACVLEHQERMLGTGYPQKKNGKDITPLGRLCAVVDSYCAMVSKRPYADAMEPLKAAATLSDDQNYDRGITNVLQAMLITRTKLK